MNRQDDGEGIPDNAAVAHVLLPLRTTLYRRIDVPREQLYLDTPGTPHNDHVSVTPEFGARIIAGLERLGEQNPSVRPEQRADAMPPKHSGER